MSCTRELRDLIRLGIEGGRSVALPRLGIEGGRSVTVVHMEGLGGPTVALRGLIVALLRFSGTSNSSM